MTITDTTTNVFTLNKMDEMTTALCDGECVTLYVGNAIATLSYDGTTETLYSEVTVDGKWGNGIEYNGVRYRSQLLDGVLWAITYLLEE